MTKKAQIFSFIFKSSGLEGGELVPGTVHLTNNLFVIDGVSAWGRQIDQAFSHSSHIE